jgi:hypothetical protein
MHGGGGGGGEEKKSQIVIFFLHALQWLIRGVVYKAL